MKKRIKIQGQLIFLAAILFFILIKFIFPNWKNESSDKWFDLVGVFFVLLGFLLRISARGYKEELSQGGNKLVTIGPYSFIRNPMYLGTLLIGTGVVSILFQWWALIIFLTAYLFIYFPQINKEEKILLKRFGQAYKDYCRSVPKYFPNLRGLFNFRIFASQLKLSWIKKEALSLILAWGIIFAIEIYEDITLFGLKGFFSEFLELLLAVLIAILVLAFFSYEKQDKFMEGW